MGDKVPQQHRAQDAAALGDGHAQSARFADPPSRLSSKSPSTPHMTSTGDGHQVAGPPSTLSSKSPSNPRTTSAGDGPEHGDESPKVTRDKSSPADGDYVEEMVAYMRKIAAETGESFVAVRKRIFFDRQADDDMMRDIQLAREKSAAVASLRARFDAGCYHMTGARHHPQQILARRGHRVSITGG